MKKLIAILLVAVLLTGCQLASMEKNEEYMDDKLVGVFVTFDYLDLPFDIEGYIRDNGISDGEVISGGSEYSGRLYAELGETGWEFPGYEGLILGQRWREDHWSGFATEGFCGIDTRVTGTDTHDGVEEEGIIYVPHDTVEFSFYCNPVYMTADGEYYATQGNSFSSGAEVYGMSMSVDQEIKWTQEEQEYSYYAKYTARIEGIVVPEQVVLIHMSDDHQELGRTEYVPGQLPESIEPMEGAAYLIVEEYAAENVTRKLCQPGDDPLQVFYRTDQVYCLPQNVTINWE